MSEPTLKELEGQLIGVHEEIGNLKALLSITQSKLAGKQKTVKNLKKKIKGIIVANAEQPESEYVTYYIKQ